MTTPVQQSTFFGAIAATATRTWDETLKPSAGRSGGNLNIPKPGETKTFVYNAGGETYKTITIIPRLADGVCADASISPKINVLNSYCSQTKV